MMFDGDNEKESAKRKDELTREERMANMLKKPTFTKMNTEEFSLYLNHINRDNIFAKILLDKKPIIKSAASPVANVVNSYSITIPTGEEFVKLRIRAEDGDATAQLHFGFAYYSGIVVSQNYAKAAEWYAKSSAQGNLIAMNELGCCYLQGLGVPKNANKAVDLYKKPASNGFAIAQLNLGTCYFSGYGVEQDYAKASEWFIKAADQGNIIAWYNLGICYRDGHGVRQSYERAKDYFAKAAKKEKLEAYFELGRLYFYGLGVEKNTQKAYEVFLPAAERGHAMSQYFVGFCLWESLKETDFADAKAQYIEYRNLPQAAKNGLIWIEKAAAQNCEPANFFLNKMKPYIIM